MNYTDGLTPDTNDCSFLISVIKLNKYVSKTVNKQLVVLSLNISRFLTLRAINQAPVYRVQMLAKRLQSDRTTVDRGIKVLVRGGLVYWDRSSGKRTLLLTDKGSSVLDAAFKIIEAVDKEMLWLWRQSTFKVYNDDTTKSYDRFGHEVKDFIFNAKGAVCNG